MEREVASLEGGWAIAVCPSCGANFRFRRLPSCVVLESDVLWGAIEACADDDYRSCWRAWLLLVPNVHQASRQVVLGGTVTPG